MPIDRPQSSVVRIVAPTPLLRTGLASLVTRSHATPTDDLAAPIILRTGCTAAHDADIDIAVHDDRVTIGVHRLPDHVTWRTAYRLLEVLMSNLAGLEIAERSRGTAEPRASQHELRN